MHGRLLLLRTVHGSLPLHAACQGCLLHGGGSRVRRRCHLLLPCCTHRLVVCRHGCHLLLLLLLILEGNGDVHWHQHWAWHKHRQRLGRHGSLSEALHGFLWARTPCRLTPCPPLQPQLLLLPCLLVVVRALPPLLHVPWLLLCLLPRRLLLLRRRRWRRLVVVALLLLLLLLALLSCRLLLRLLHASAGTRAISRQAAERVPCWQSRSLRGPLLRWRRRWRRRLGLLPRLLLPSWLLLSLLKEQLQ